MAANSGNNMPMSFAIKTLDNDNGIDDDDGFRF